MEQHPRPTQKEFKLVSPEIVEAINSPLQCRVIYVRNQKDLNFLNKYFRLLYRVQKVFISGIEEINLEKDLEFVKRDALIELESEKNLKIYNYEYEYPITRNTLINGKDIWTYIFNSKNSLIFECGECEECECDGCGEPQCQCICFEEE